MFVHKPHLYLHSWSVTNCIPEAWHHTPPTENMHCKISSLSLRHSAITSHFAILQCPKLTNKMTWLLCLNLQIKLLMSRLVDCAYNHVRLHIVHMSIHLISVKCSIPRSCILAFSVAWWKCLSNLALIMHTMPEQYSPIYTSTLHQHFKSV